MFELRRVSMEVYSKRMSLKGNFSELRCDVNELEFTNISML